MTDDAPKAKKATKKAPKAGGEVMAKLRAEKAKKKAKASNKVKLGRKGAERPAEDEALEAHERKIQKGAEATKGKREEAHFGDTPQQRVAGHAGARGRRTQARRDQKG